MNRYTLWFYVDLSNNINDFKAKMIPGEVFPYVSEKAEWLCHSDIGW